MMHPITLGNTNQPAHKMKFCNKCNEIKPPEGGIEMGAKWHCQACWTRRMTIGNIRKKN